MKLIMDMMMNSRKSIYQDNQLIVLVQKMNEQKALNLTLQGLSESRRVGQDYIGQQKTEEVEETFRTAKPMGQPKATTIRGVSID